MWENKGQDNSEYGHFSGSDKNSALMKFPVTGKVLVF